MVGSMVGLIWDRWSHSIWFPQNLQLCVKDKKFKFLMTQENNLQNAFRQTLNVILYGLPCFFFFANLFAFSLTYPSLLSLCTLMEIFLTFPDIF